MRVELEDWEIEMLILAIRNYKLSDCVSIKQENIYNEIQARLCEILDLNEQIKKY